MKFRLLLISIFTTAVSFSACKRYDPAGELIPTHYTLSAYADLNIGGARLSSPLQYFHGPGDKRAMIASSSNSLDNDHKFSRDERVLYRDYNLNDDLKPSDDLPADLAFKPGKKHSLLIFDPSSSDGVLFLEDDFTGKSEVGIRLIIKATDKKNALNQKYHIQARAYYEGVAAPKDWQLIIDGVGLERDPDTYLSKFQSFNKQNEGKFIEAIEFRLKEKVSGSNGSTFKITLPVPPDNATTARDNLDLNLTIVCELRGSVDNLEFGDQADFSIFDHEPN